TRVGAGFGHRVGAGERKDLELFETGERQAAPVDRYLSRGEGDCVFAGRAVDDQGVRVPATVHRRKYVLRQTRDRHLVRGVAGAELELLDVGKRDGSAVDTHLTGGECYRVLSVRAVDHQRIRPRAAVHRKGGGTRGEIVHRHGVRAAEGVYLQLFAIRVRHGL